MAKKVTDCPCGSGNTYKQCCAPLHNGAPAHNAEALMRSRYAAFALRDAEYLNRSWHNSTQPNDLTAESLKGTKWLGLTIIATTQPTSTDATVSFEARFKDNDAKAAVLKETSRFVQENGHWFYVDGDIHA